MSFMQLLFWVRGGDMINFKKIVFVTISLLFALQVCAKQKEKIPDFSGEWESIADFCSFRAYHSYKLKQKKDTVTGYFNAGASKGQGGDWGRVKGKIRHGKLFIRECSTSETNDIYACPKYSPEFKFLVKKRKVILRYHNPKYSVLTKEQRKETKDNPFVLYKIYKKNYIPPVQKMHCQ